MPAKTDEAANSAKSAPPAEPAAKTPAAESHGSASAANSGQPPSLDSAFKSLITQQLARLFQSIKQELRDAQAAGPAANGPAADAPPKPDDAPAAARAAPSGGTSPAGHDELRRIIEDIGVRQTGLSHQVVEQVGLVMRREMQALEARLTRIEEAVREPPPAPAPAPVAVPVRPQQPQFQSVEIDDDRWKELILGEELCNDHSLAETRNRLFRGVLSEDDAAKALAGQMLLVQAATPDRLPPLMKDVGEAYYRWRPKTGGTSDPFETALAAYLKRRCDAGGLGNAIELVVVGDRFDATRHNSTERGATITAVQGWVVLRDNGKVYTKANVSVK